MHKLPILDISGPKSSTKNDQSLLKCHPGGKVSGAHRREQGRRHDDRRRRRGGRRREGERRFQDAGDGGEPALDGFVGAEEEEE